LNEKNKRKIEENSINWNGIPFLDESSGRKAYGKLLFFLLHLFLVTFLGLGSRLTEMGTSSEVKRLSFEKGKC